MSGLDPSVARWQQVIGAAVLVRQGKVLILQRRQDAGILPGDWEFPEGKKELGETIQEAVQRECREETGLEIKLGKVIDVFEYGVDSHHVVRDCTQINYLCIDQHPDQAVVLSDEHQAYRWIGPTELAVVTNANRRQTLSQVFVQREPVRRYTARLVKAKQARQG